MKKKYIIPAIVCIATGSQTILAGSFVPEIDRENKATEEDVTAKKHTLWGTTWDDEEEEEY